MKRSELRKAALAFDAIRQAEEQRVRWSLLRFDGDPDKDDVVTLMLNPEYDEAEDSVDIPVELAKEWAVKVLEIKIARLLEEAGIENDGPWNEDD